MRILKIKMMPFTVILFFGFSVSFAQFMVPFKMRYQNYVKGDMTIIANNSINRVDYNNNANQPYYNHTNSSSLNEEFNMEYIDIDEDETTFSSSSAELFYENPSNKKIVYAGLYWSATYKYNEGIQKKEEKFSATDSNRESFTNVKLKLPNQENYIDVSGQTIFDGLNEKETKDFAPYAVYADITEYVKKLANPTGVYTIANIKATQGKISGGVAAGWTIFIVYEDQSKNEKYITSYDGFAIGTEKTNDIVFSNKLDLPKGQIKVKIAGAALEGDNNFIGDQLLFGDNEKHTISNLSNSIRKENNFFNSCISIENQFYSNRFPDSKNTLGYDTFLFTVPNPNNSVVGNDTKESVLRLKSAGDNYFMFFTAFSEESVAPPMEKEIAKENSLVYSKEDKTQKIVVSNNTIRFITANNDFVVDDNKTVSAMNRLYKNTTFNNTKNLIEIQTLNISSLPSGYYLIANIFKTEQKAQEFVSYLKAKKCSSDFFTNTLNNYKYVYIKKTDNQKDAIDSFLSKLDNTYEERIQILSLNKSEYELVAEAQKSEKIEEKKAPFEIQVVDIPNEPKGYYLVANVFSVKENTTNFMNLLKAKGFNPKLLVNPENDYKYVYLKKTDNRQEAIDLYLSKMNNTYLDKMWVLSVNNSNAIITSNDD